MRLEATEHGFRKKGNESKRILTSVPMGNRIILSLFRTVENLVGKAVYKQACYDFSHQISYRRNLRDFLSGFAGQEDAQS